MSRYFAAIPVSNARLLCVGGVSEREAAEARGLDLDVDGSGYYLFLAEADRPSEPIEILAKFYSPDQAEYAASLLPVS